MANDEGPALWGHDLFGNPITPYSMSPLATRYVVPPFSVLSAREGEWQTRKRAWIDLGIKSEIGRDAKTYNTGDMPFTEGRDSGGGVSIFDPVLCEIAYRYWSAPGDTVLDPFAGGSVRGVVAALLGRHYWGCDLRAEQVAANREQAQRLCADIMPRWMAGDSMVEMDTHAPLADMVFSCPPYGDLEVYSDDPADLSTMEWNTFAPAYKRIIMRACARLRPDRFACFVVSNYRDTRTGHYRDLVGETISGFAAGGCGLYNDAILVTPAGTAPVRAEGQFSGGRKLVKVHQNVLVFVKGDWRSAGRRCAEER